VGCCREQRESCHGEQTEVGEAEEAEIDRQSLVSRRFLPGETGVVAEKEQGWGRIIIQTVWGWVAPFQNAFIGKVGAMVSVAAQKMGGEFVQPMGRVIGNATNCGWSDSVGKATPSLRTSGGGACQCGRNHWRCPP
jgi:hypothetical protein